MGFWLTVSLSKLSSLSIFLHLVVKSRNYCLSHKTHQCQNVSLIENCSRGGPEVHTTITNHKTQQITKYKDTSELQRKDTVPDHFLNELREDLRLEPVIRPLIFTLHPADLNICSPGQRWLVAKMFLLGWGFNINPELSNWWLHPMKLQAIWWTVLHTTASWLPVVDVANGAESNRQFPQLLINLIRGLWLGLGLLNWGNGRLDRLGLIKWKNIEM